MSDVWELKLVRAEVDRLLVLASKDDDLRAALRSLAEEILAATRPEPDAPADAATVVAPDEPLHELTLGRAMATASDTRSHQSEFWEPVAGGRPDDLEESCRRKASAARWAYERGRTAPPGVVAEGGADEPAGPELRAWAEGLVDGIYWAAAEDQSGTVGIDLLGDVAGCFEAVASALALVDASRDRPGALERVLGLLAEAQSALRRALRRIQAPDDPDQLAAYEWVREVAARHRIFLKRYMRADDQADPSRWPDLRKRIEAAAGGGQGDSPRFERLRQLVERIPRDDSGWILIIEAVEALLRGGTPPSDRRIRDLLLPVIDALPDLADLPPGFRLVLREIDRYLATRPLVHERAIQPEPTAEVVEAARLLGGRRVVLIGGDRRPEAQEALERSLGLEELTWIETKEHQSVASFEPAVARPEVALVLLAIRWSSHAFGEVRQQCDRHGKPLVRLPGGYGPNQVAAQVLAQCGDRLRAARPTLLRPAEAGRAAIVEPGPGLSW